MSPHHVTSLDLDGVLLATVSAGLFDRMPEMLQSGPTNAEILDELAAGLESSPAPVLLDIRVAGEMNHRTVGLLFQMAKRLSTRGARYAICGTDEAKQIWDICKFEQVAPFFVEMSQALRALGVGKDEFD